MSKYLFSLFVRFFIALSGVIVFLATSQLYGSEGRGVIGFGTSLVSVFGLLFSFNLGRTFLSETNKSEYLKEKKLPNFLGITYFLIFVAIIFSGAFWFFYPHAREIIDSSTIFAFLLLMPYFLWSVNGVTIYATLNKTLTQDLIIFIVRLILIALVLLIWFLKIENIKFFLFLYSLTLGLGAMLEIIFLGKPEINLIKFTKIKKYLSKSKISHLDSLAFNLYPLMLMIMSASFLKLPDLGKLNFVIQLINFIFIFSIVGSIKMKSYVSTSGVFAHRRSIIKLFSLTIAASVFSVLIVYFFLKSHFFLENFKTFGNVENYFLLVSISIPGYLAYQFLYPALIEYHRMNSSMRANLITFVILVSVSYSMLKLYGLLGACILFATFHLLILISQVFLFQQLRPILTNK